MIAHLLAFAAYSRTLVMQQLADFGPGDRGLGDPLRWVARSGWGVWRLRRAEARAPGGGRPTRRQYVTRR